MLILALFIVVCIPFDIFGQKSEEILRKRIEKIISSQKSDIGTSISGIADNDTPSINGDKCYPMKSVSSFILR